MWPLKLTIKIILNYPGLTNFLVYKYIPKFFKTAFVHYLMKILRVN